MLYRTLVQCLVFLSLERCIVAYAPDQLPALGTGLPANATLLNAGCFEAMVNDLRSVLRVAQTRQGQPSAAILDRRTLQSTCESGPRVGYHGYERKRGSKVHMAVDTLGLLLAVHITPANEQECAQVAELARQVQQVTGQTVKLAFADQGYTGNTAAHAAREEGIELQVIKLSEAKKGFVPLPCRWVVERSFGWLNRFRRLARDYEHLAETLAGLHFVVFAMLMLVHAGPIMQSS